MRSHEAHHPPIRNFTKEIVEPIKSTGFTFILLLIFNGKLLMDFHKILVISQ